MIRQAKHCDINSILCLLRQVADIHHQIRPDLFKNDTTKYDNNNLSVLIEQSDQTPVFVYEREGVVYGYIFCRIVEVSGDRLLQDHKTLYIDDLCVDKDHRHAHIGTALFDYALNYAQHIACNNVTLNVWSGNDEALAFYQNRGMMVQKQCMEIIL